MLSPSIKKLPLMTIKFKSLSFGLVSSLGLVTLGLSSLLLTGCISNSTLKSEPSKTLLSKTSNPAQPQINAEVTTDDFKVKLQENIYHPIIWDEMRYKFDLADEHFEHYADFLGFYHSRKTHLKRVSERAKPYLYFILSEVKKRNMPYEIALLPAVESGFRPIARSHQKAVGLWQFIPSTGDLYDLDQTWWYDGRKDIVESTRAALDYLQKLYKLNNNDWLLALASYNAGLGNVYKAQRKYRKANKDRANIAKYQPNFWEIQQFLPKETQSYVPKLLSMAHIIEYANRFNIALEPIANHAYFSQIVLDKQVSLGQVAKLSSTTREVLASLNPGFHQPATPPNGPYDLLLPVDKAETFEKQIENNQAIFDIHWQKHKIRSGDSLSVIAHKYKTSAKAIKRLNGMKSSRIRAGKTLLIPIPADKFSLVKTQLASASQAKLHSKKTLHKHAESTHNDKHNHKHTVKSGESLWLLAKKYNLSTKQIASRNHLSVKTALRIGQQLIIPNYEQRVKIEHTLKEGESLWLVAKHYDVHSKDIAAWNHISTKKILQPGMKLTIWSKQSSLKYVVKTGDNLWNIAKANQLSAKKLASHNNLSLKSLLKPGQVIKIPLDTGKNT